MNLQISIGTFWFCFS